MTRPDLLSLAERFMASHDWLMHGTPPGKMTVGAGDYADMHALLRKLAELRPVAWSVVGSNVFCDGLYTKQAFAEAIASNRKDGSRVEPLYTLSEVLTDE